MVKIVLTADRAVFTDFNGVDALGFGLCLPYRLVPWIIEYLVLAPKISVKDGVRARIAPYPLAKIEAALLATGFKHDDVAIVPPEKIHKVIDRDTAIVGIHVLDPRGLSPVSWTLQVMTGGGKSCTAYEFEKLIRRVQKLKAVYRFKVVVGGPGVWQLRGFERVLGIDVLFDGEAEITFPSIAKKILNGEEVPSYVVGEQPSIEMIPPIITPSRNGLVEITRGCPRRCQFCSPTMRYFRSIPLETIIKEIDVNLRNGIKIVSFITEDVLLYGSQNLKINEDAIKRLYIEALSKSKAYGVSQIGFTHVSCASAYSAPHLVKFISDVNGFDADNPIFPQVGLESGSVRIVEKFFRGKTYPYPPEKWPEIVVSSAKLFNDNYWYPCFTYIVGFPGEEVEDHIKTLELLDTLESEGFKGWTFPLFLIPMGDTLIENKASFKYLKDLSKEAVDTIVKGWKMSLRFSREIYRKLIRVRNPIAMRIVNAFAELAFKAMEQWIEGLSKDPEKALVEYSKVEIRGLRQLVGAVIRMLF